MRIFKKIGRVLDKVQEIVDAANARKSVLRTPGDENMVRLNVGGGKGHAKTPGWTTVDLRDTADVVVNITSDPLPFDDNSVDIIYTSHTLEHIYAKDLGFVLGEFYRVLKPGGLLRIVVPDIEKACRAYVNRDFGFFKDSDPTVFDRDAPIGGYLASWFYSISTVGNGHVHCFDYEYLAYFLKKNGFKRISRMSYRVSNYREFKTNGLDLPRHKNDSLYVECFK